MGCSLSIVCGSLGRRRGSIISSSSRKVSKNVGRKMHSKVGRKMAMVVDRKVGWKAGR